MGKDKADLIHLFGPDGFQPPPELTPDPPEHQLIDAMAEHGIQCSEVVLDGELHRFGPDKTCWYAAHADGVPAGAFGNWRTGAHETWVADIGRRLSDEERALSMAQIEAAIERRKAAEAEKHRHAATRALDIWENSAPADPSHPYLARKGVSPGPAKMLEDGRLVLPMWDHEGQLCSVQLISQSGDKKFLKGGRVSGCFGSIGTMVGATSCYLAEGFATASTIHQETGCPVFWSYSAQNLPAVAEFVATLGAPMTIVADNDENGTGAKHARKAADKTGCSIVMPPEGDANDYAQSGGDVKTLLGHTTDAWLIPFSELTQQPRPIKWLIKGWLPQSCLSMVFGPSGIGKTFFVLDMALSISTGQEWSGSLVNQAGVAYLAGEGYAGISQRLKGWAQVHNVQDAPFWVSRGGVALDTPDGYNHARTAIAALETRPGLIIVDTLHRFLSGDENSSQDAGKMIRACDQLGREFNATVLLVHHTGHGGERSRGSTAWKGALDVEIGISKFEDGELILARNHKQKDAESASDIYGLLESVELPWVDDEGEPIGTAVWARQEQPQENKQDKFANEIKLLERAWFATQAEDIDGAPYITKAGLERYLENEGGRDARALKRETDGPKGLVSTLTRAEVIAHHQYGWCVVDSDLITRFMISRGR